VLLTEEDFDTVMVFVLDKNGKALMSCTEKRARLLLERNRALIHRLYPMVIRVRDRLAQNCSFQDLNLKLDPGSKTSGVALNRITETGEAVLNLFELVQRGALISKKLLARKQMRRTRRARNTRYRQARFLNRGNKVKGWLAPSLMHRVNTTIAWVNRISHWAPVSKLTQELVRFDLQKMQNPEISGVEYQQGTLFGFEVPEYLLNKWNRTCAYCDAQNTPLEIEHIHPKSKGGSNRISNLALACRQCNKIKDNRDIAEFLMKDEKRLKRILAQAKAPLKDGAAVNSTRWRLFNELKASGLEVNVGTSGQTKFNRTRNNIPKTHSLDAACVGDVDVVSDWQKPTLYSQCAVRGQYARTRLDRFGFPRVYCVRQKQVKGFATEDTVRAEVTRGKKIGSYFGKVAIRASGSFNITNETSVIQGVSHQYCKLVQRADGYGYLFNQDSLLSREKGLVQQAALSLPGIKATVSRAN
jgi:5-methylcytosine-specific restriction endonuclease McrA